MEQKIKRVDLELNYKGAILDFYTDHMQLPNGKVAKWDCVEHRKGAAAVLPILPNGNILLVRQYRNAIQRETLEIPAGGRNSIDEPHVLCAARELEEETGYKCDTLEFLVSIHTTAAFCNEEIKIFLAKDLIPSKQHLDSDEFLEVEEYQLDEVCQWIYEGKLQDSKTVAAVLAYKNKYVK